MQLLRNFNVIYIILMLFWIRNMVVFKYGVLLNISASGDTNATFLNIDLKKNLSN